MKITRRCKLFLKILKSIFSMLTVTVRYKMSWTEPLEVKFVF